MFTVAMLLTLAIPLTVAIPLNMAILLAMAAAGAGGVGLTAPGHAYYGYTTYYGNILLWPYYGYTTYYGYTMGMLLQRPVLTMSILTMAAGGAGGVGLPDGTAAAAAG